MIQRSRLIFCMFALILVGRHATAQTPPAKDFQQWTQVAATWQVKPKLTVTTFGEVHIGNDVSQFDQEIVSAGVTYSPSRWVSVGAGYLYLHANPKLSGLNYENRLYGEVTFNAPAFHKFLLSDRVRPELRWEHAPAGATFTQRYRNRVTLQRPINIRERKYSPFVMWEKFYNANVESLSRARYYAGATVPMEGRTSLQFYFMRQNDQFSRPFHKNAVGASVMFNCLSRRMRRAMSLQEKSDLVLAFARVLYVNGESTDDTITASARLSESLGLRATIIPRWGEIQLLAADGAGELVSVVKAEPTGVDMDRVVSTWRAVEEFRAGKLTSSAAFERLKAISHAAPAPTLLFTLAAAAGTVALSVIFGVSHLAAVVLIAASAAVGAVLRRTLARYSTNALLQPFCAALLAGVVGALAVRFQLSSSLRLVAVCPCMILVPGPHGLKGMIDLINARVSLGACRLIFSGLVVLAISVGLLVGLGLLGVSLPVEASGRAVPLWLDTLSAGVAVAAYSIFFSTPLRMLGWPVAVGMLAHALRWLTLALGAGAATGAFVACLLVGLVLTPVARRHRMPFAAVGFASVVSLIPGVLLFRLGSGLLQLADSSNMTLPLLGGTVADGVTAVNIILAMSFGLIVPKLIIDRLWRTREIRFGDRRTNDVQLLPRLVGKLAARSKS